MEGKRVILPEIGPVAMAEGLRISGSIREVTVNRTADVWFACFCAEDGQEPPLVKEGPTIGVDVGVGVMATCSDSMVVENPKALSRALNQLRRIDQAIARSRKVHGRNNNSRRRERLCAKRRRLHARAANVRSDNQHKATTTLAKPAGRVVVGTLDVSGLMRSHRGPGPGRCGDVWLPGTAGVQVPVVRRRVFEGGPLLCVVKVTLPLPLEER